MPETSQPTYSAALPLPDMLERGAVNRLTCAMVRSAEYVAPTVEGSTLNVYDQLGAVRLADEPIEVTEGGIAFVDWTPDAALPFGEGWTVEWTLNMPDGVHTVRNEALLVRRRLYCPINELDIQRRRPSLSTISGNTDHQQAIDEAWLQLQLRLLERGNRTNLIISASALREAMIELTLAIILADVQTRNNAAYADQAAEHRAAFEHRLSAVRWLYQPDEETRSTERAKRTGRSGSVWLL